MINIGLPEIDGDHASIAEAFDKLSDPEIYADPSQRILVVESFLDYSTNHLDREEKLMRQLDYPAYTHHRGAHLNLQQAFLKLVKPALKGTADHATLTAIFHKIFVGHIDAHDQPLVDWIFANNKLPTKKH
jgi:hemerythrin-like metal-binding protein